MSQDAVRQIDDDWLRSCYRSLFPYAKATAWKSWVEEVRRIDAQLHPGGRAVLRQPAARYVVELRWGSEPRPSYKARPVWTACRVLPDPGEDLPWEDISVGTYMTALYYALLLRTRLTGQGPEDEDIHPPAPGRPASVGWYRHLLAEYDELVGQHERAPIRELALRYGVPDGTVKSWRSRGKKYLDIKEKREKR